MTQTRVPSGALVIYTLPALTLIIGVLLTLGFAGLMLSLLAGLQAQAALLQTNPFAGYEALLPGQSLTSVIAYAQSTPEGYITSRADPPWTRQYLGRVLNLVYRVSSTNDRPAVCEDDSPNDGIFSKVILIIDADRVRELHLLSTALQQESLLLYWGAPDVVGISTNRQLFELTWGRRTYSATALVAGTASVVERIILTAKN